MPMRLRIRRLLIKSVLFLVLLGVALWLLFCAAGIPSWAVPRVQSVLSRGGYAVEARAMYSDLRGGLVLNDVRIYRRGVIGPPVVEAERLAVHCLPWNVLIRARPVWDVALSGCRILPEQLRRRAGRQPVSRPAGANGETPRPADSLWRRIMRVRLDVADAYVWGAQVRHLSARIDRKPDALAIRGISGYIGGPRGKAGAFDGDAVHTLPDGVWTGALETGFDPGLVAEMITALRLTGLSWALRRFDFGTEPPRVDLAYRLAPGEVEVRGRFSGRDLSYNGVDLLRLDGTLAVEASSTNTFVTLDPMLVVREEGIARGGVTLNRQAGTATFHGRSAIAPRALLEIVDVLDPGDAVWWSCGGPTEITAQGRADLQGRAGTAFRADVRARDLTVRGFTADTASFTVSVLGRTNRVTDIRGRLYGGEIGGSVTFVSGAAPDVPDQYVLSGTVRDADFGRVAATLGAEAGNEYEGRLSGDVRLGGRTGPDAWRSVQGAGSVKVVQGHLFRLPVFGGFSRMMSRLIPGLDFLVSQSDARAAFTVADGMVVSDKVRIEGDVMSLTGTGAYALDGALDFDVQVTLMKEHTLVARVLRTVTAPLSKLLEMRLEGTLAEPTWRSPLLSSGPAPERPEP
jgi:hypothetical protein